MQKYFPPETIGFAFIQISLDFVQNDTENAEGAGISRRSIHIMLIFTDKIHKNLDMKNISHGYGALIRTLATAAILLTGSEDISGQDHFMTYRILDQAGGLQSDRVTSIAKDRLGTLWVGTTRGLDRFCENKVISCDTDEFFNRPVRFVVTDDTGQVWAGVFGGLFRYDSQTGSFANVTVNGNGFHPMSYDFTSDGILFYAEEGFVRYNYADGSLSFSDHGQKSGEWYRYFKLMNDTTAIAVKYPDAIYRLNLSSGTEKKTRTPGSGNSINGLHIDSDKRIWVSVYNTGLMCLTPDGENTIRYFPIDGSLLKGHIPINMHEHDGYLYIMTDGGGIRSVNLANLEEADTESCMGCSLPVQAEYASSMLFCKDEIWMGTIHHGVIQLKKSSMKHIDATDFGFGSERGANTSIVSCLTEDSSGKIWIGTDGAGISVYDPQTGTCTPFEKLKTGNINALADIGDGRMMVSVYSKGLYIIDTGTGGIRRLKARDRETEASILGQPVVVRLKKRTDGNIIISARDIYSYDTGTGEMTRYGLSGKSNFIIAYCGPDFIVVYNPYEIYLIRDRNDIRQLLYSRTGDIRQVKKAGEELYVIKSYSLSRINPENMSFEEIPFHYNGHVFSMETDRKGNLWLATQGKIIQLAKLSPDSYTVRSEDFRSDEFLPDATMASSSGDMYFGGYSGLYIIKNGGAPAVQDRTDIAILSASIDGENAGYSIPESSEAPVITVPWNYSSLDLNIYTIGSDVFTQNEYRYTVRKGKKRTVIYSDSHLALPALDPGTYDIDIACIDRTDRWISHNDILSVTVLAPPEKLFSL